MAKDRVGRVEEIPCMKCGMSRHTIRGTYAAHWEENHGDITADATIDLMECNGCQRATLRDESWFSEEPGESTVTYWPPRRGDSPLREPRNFEQLD
jgi:hypothetical protein